MSGKLKPKQAQAIAALLSSPSNAEAAAAVGISDTTLWRWQNDPDFQRAYRAARRRAVDGSVARLQALTDDAVATIRDVMESEGTPPAQRVSAARVVLEQALRATQIEALEERIEELEEQVRESKMKGRRHEFA
jgi:hypothetical protein